MEDRFDRDLELPLLPDTAAQVLAACNEDSCDARQLADLLQRDQSLAGHVLSVSNSAAYAPKEPIVSLQQAVSRLGISTICEIAIAVSMKGRVFNVPGYHVKIREMWMHSAATAVYAKEVARFLRRNVDSAFMCGLLHDVGRPFVLQTLVDEVKTKTNQPIPATIVDAALDAYHERLGAAIVQHWSLAEWASEAVRHHHAFEEAGEFVEEAKITCLADLLSHWALDERAEPDDFPAEHRVVRALEIYAEDVMQLLDERGRVIEVAEAFL